MFRGVSETECSQFRVGKPGDTSSGDDDGGRLDPHDVSCGIYLGKDIENTKTKSDCCVFVFGRGSMGAKINF